MTAVESSSDDDVPLASKVTDVKIKDEVGLDEKTEVGMDAKKSMPGSGKSKSTEKKKTQTVKKTGSNISKQASNKKNATKVDEAKIADKKKPKKVYDMPGQTRDTPGEDDPQRRFYTSLLEQIPSSEMAKKWCIIHGLLPIEDAKKWVAKNGKKTAPATATKKSKASAPAAKRSRAPAAGKKESTKAATGKDRQKVVKKKAKVTYKEDPSDSDEEVIPAKRLRVVRKSKVPSSSPIAKYKDALNFSDSDSDVPIAQKVGT